MYYFERDVRMLLALTQFSWFWFSFCSCHFTVGWQGTVKALLLLATWYWFCVSLYRVGSRDWDWCVFVECRCRGHFAITLIVFFFVSSFVPLQYSYMCFPYSLIHRSECWTLMTQDTYIILILWFISWPFIIRKCICTMHVVQSFWRWILVNNIKRSRQHWMV